MLLYSLYVAWLIYGGSVELMSHARCKYTFFFCSNSLKYITILAVDVLRRGLWSQAVSNANVVMY